MHSTNYRDTLILPSPDCAAADASRPERQGSIAQMQHERLTCAPYALTSDNLLFGIYAVRRNIAEGERDAARQAFFSKGQACLRASPLVKSYGWALHHDTEERVALIDPAGSRFSELMARDDVKKLAGLRSRRG